MHGVSHPSASRPTTATYDGAMRRRHLVREHVAMFFTNWRDPAYGFWQKVGLTFRNRALALTRGGCCGNHGQPGC
jgi:peptidoglycan/xylan/chitin deacetylase (PgdA/CDA1 family)